MTPQTQTAISLAKYFNPEDPDANARGAALANALLGNIMATRNGSGPRFTGDDFRRLGQLLVTADVPPLMALGEDELVYGSGDSASDGGVGDVRAIGRANFRAPHVATADPSDTARPPARDLDEEAHNDTSPRE